jgi:hypothetical protein
MFTLLFLPSVLWPRQIRGSEETAGIQGEDYSFPVAYERPERGFRVDMGRPQPLSGEVTQD